MWSPLDSSVIFKHLAFITKHVWLLFLIYNIAQLIKFPINVSFWWNFEPVEICQKFSFLLTEASWDMSKIQHPADRLWLQEFFKSIINVILSLEQRGEATLVCGAECSESEIVRENYPNLCRLKIKKSNWQNMVINSNFCFEFIICIHILGQNKVQTNFEWSSKTLHIGK